MTEAVRAWAKDENGEMYEVFPVVINSIAPIVRAEEARAVALDHMHNWEGNASCGLSQMMPQTLGVVGTGIPTHVFCSRDGYTHQVTMLDEHLAQIENAVTAGHTFDMSFDSVEVLVKFCVVIGDTQAMLDRLGLEVIE